MKIQSKHRQDIKNRTYRYSVRTILFIDSFPKNSNRSVLLKQLLRSATSIGANLVEAQAAHTKREFIVFLRYSLKSANETLYWLDLLKYTEGINITELSFLIAEAEELAKIVASSILKLTGNKCVNK